MKDDERLAELAKMPRVDPFENWQDEHEIDPEDFKYRIDGYEDYIGASNILKPQFRTLYTPETDQQFTETNAALDALLKKDSTDLIKPEKERIVILLRARGFTLNEICSRVELSKPTVIKTIRKFANEIANLKKVEIEELVQLYSLTLRKRIETFGKIQGVLLAELETRDAKDISTDKLIELILKCDRAVSDYILEKIAAGADEEGKMGVANLY